MIEQYCTSLTTLVCCILGLFNEICQHCDPGTSIIYCECNGYNHCRTCCVDTSHSACIALRIAVQPIHHAATMETIKSTACEGVNSPFACNNLEASRHNCVFAAIHNVNDATKVHSNIYSCFWAPQQFQFAQITQPAILSQSQNEYSRLLGILNVSGPDQMRWTAEGMILVSIV